MSCLNKASQDTVIRYMNTCVSVQRVLLKGRQPPLLSYHRGDTAGHLNFRESRGDRNVNVRRRRGACVGCCRQMPRNRERARALCFLLISSTKQYVYYLLWHAVRVGCARKMHCTNRNHASSINDAMASGGLKFHVIVHLCFGGNDHIYQCRLISPRDSARHAPSSRAVEPVLSVETTEGRRRRRDVPCSFLIS